MKTIDQFNILPYEFNVYGEDVCLYLYENQIDASCLHIRQTHTFCEYYLLEYIKDILPEGHTIIDAGANFGNETIYFSKFLNYQRIFSFEPHPANFELLRMNTAKLLNVDIFDVALGDTLGYVSLQESTTDMNDIHTIPGNEIRIKPLDYYNFQNVDLMKLDVQGFEPNILIGGIETIRRCRPYIFVEVHYNDCSEISDLLTSLDYRFVKEGFNEMHEYSPS